MTDIESERVTGINSESLTTFIGISTHSTKHANLAKNLEL